MEPKLTPTTNDALHSKRKRVPKGNGLHLIATHEPVAEVTVPEFLQMAANFPGMPVGLPAVTAEPQPLKIALIGTAPSSRMMAPFNDPAWKIWACSPGNAHGTLPRIDTWFEIHGNMLWPENQHYGAPYLEWLKKQTFPIYMQDTSFVPNAIPLPMNELVREFGGDFFTSSFAWMMAMAMKAGAKEIALYGIDMASRDEYILQRPGFYFFKYMAEQRGIKVSAPHESDIMQPPGLYGFSDVTPFGRKMLARKKELQERLAPIERQMQELQQQATYLRGALEDIDYVHSIWSGAQSHAQLKSLTG